MQPHDAAQPAPAPSAAWAAAQQLFSTRPALPADPPVVVVRKGKLPTRDAADGTATDADAAPAVREARVFRLVPAVASSPAAEAPPLDAPEAVDVAPPLPLPPARLRRRVAPDKRPGPVLRISVPPAPQEPAAEALAAPPVLPAHRARDLIDMLAHVEAIADDIRRAQDFHFKLEPQQG